MFSGWGPASPLISEGREVRSVLPYSTVVDEVSLVREKPDTPLGAMVSPSWPHHRDLKNRQKPSCMQGNVSLFIVVKVF